MTTFGCKTNSFVGHYNRIWETSYSNLDISSDSSYSFGVSACMVSGQLNGKWTTEGRLLHLVPVIPADIYFDETTKRYRFKLQDTVLTSISSQKPTISDIKVFADITTDYSTQTFKLKNNKLYQQYKDNGKIKYDKCPFYRVPEDTLEAQRLRRKFEIKCSGLGPMDRLLIRLRLKK